MIALRALLIFVDSFALLSLLAFVARKVLL